MSNLDPWETRTQDEIDGVHWPAPAILTPEQYAALREQAVSMGRNMGQQREQIMAGILEAST